MYGWVENTKDHTILYEVQIVKWSLCVLYFNISELFEYTGFPRLYREFFHKGEKPTFLEWLKRHPRWWSKKTLYPSGTKIKFRKRRITQSYINYISSRPFSDFL